MYLQRAWCLPAVERGYGGRPPINIAWFSDAGASDLRFSIALGFQPLSEVLFGHSRTCKFYISMSLLFIKNIDYIIIIICMQYSYYIASFYAYYIKNKIRNGKCGVDTPSAVISLCSVITQSASHHITPPYFEIWFSVIVPRITASILLTCFRSK